MEAFKNMKIRQFVVRKFMATPNGALHSGADETLYRGRVVCEAESCDSRRKHLPALLHTENRHVVSPRLSLLAALSLSLSLSVYVCFLSAPLSPTPPPSSLSSA
ncbi:unnamed protein product [Caenorhabditis auriculariae]|uniref:Uncharacterized protein n=1 Tax=Caenorhabditis auriculariae TaxID=2777116 RepID=A0A8S1H9K3_9PELO|nr:unnamed protein product [Caenorhabditis auriculariae]